MAHFCGCDQNENWIKKIQNEDTFQKPIGGKKNIV